MPENEKLPLKLQLNNKELKTIKFPILCMDFEAYHLLKDGNKIDYFPNINDKPFLLGIIVIENDFQLSEVLQTRKFNYYTFTCWKINNKNGHVWKKFAQKLNMIVAKYDIKSFLTMGAKLELEVINLLHQLNLLTKQTQNVQIYDIYQYYNSQKKGENTDQQEIVLALNNSFFETSEKQIISKKEWNEIWRKLDQIYSFFTEKELKKFQKMYYKQILIKNYTDLIKLIILFAKKYNNYV